MKKTSTVVKEENTYEIDILINNTAYIKSITGKTGLLNIKTNQIIGEMDDFYTIYDPNSKLYYQIKGDISSNDDPTSKVTIRIYDALNEKMLVDGWEVVKRFSKKFNLILVKSPIDGKLHLFDKSTYRKPTNIFDMALDDVKILFHGEVNDSYFVVMANGKKGLYYYNYYDETSNLVSPIKYDNIEKCPNTIVYTKDNQKYFVYTINGMTSSNFDEITIDKNNPNIVYCKKGNKIYAYNTKAQRLLLSTDADEIKYMYKREDQYDNGEYSLNGEYFFEIKKDGKYGIMSSVMINKKDYKKKTDTVVLPPNYDEIKTVDNVSFLKKGDKVGLFVGNFSHNHQVIEPKYDNIDSLGNGYFALYTNGLCDIGKVNPVDPNKSFALIITNCEIIENGITKKVYKRLIYKKDGKYGFLSLDNDKKYYKDVIIPPKYDSISNVTNKYVIIEKNNKKGLMNIGEVIISTEYDEISLGGLYGKYEDLDNAKKIYVALKKGNKYELGKMNNFYDRTTNFKVVNEHTFDKIEFFREIMVLRNQTHTYIYDYNENLLKILPTDTTITVMVKSSSAHEKHYFYCINGIYYYYINGNLEQAFVEEKDFYVTTYETGTDLFEAKTINKKEHDAFCDYIDTQADDLAEKSLLELSNDGQALKEKYPTLVLKKTKKL